MGLLKGLENHHTNQWGLAVKPPFCYLRLLTKSPANYSELQYGPTEITGFEVCHIMVVDGPYCSLLRPILKT